VLALLLTCRQDSKEIADILYSKSIFVATCGPFQFAGPDTHEHDSRGMASEFARSIMIRAGGWLHKIGTMRRLVRDLRIDLMPLVIHEPGVRNLFPLRMERLLRYTFGVERGHQVPVSFTVQANLETHSSGLNLQNLDSLLQKARIHHG